jgi:putative DNA-invertase from lambdoid prophage Rac
MRVFGYIFLARNKHHLVPEIEQQLALQEYGRSIGVLVDEIIVEDTVLLKKPFKDRPASGELLRKCGSGDTIIVMKTEWVLSSAGDGERLLGILKTAQIALHCIDLGGNISLPEKRRLMVTEGPAVVVEKLLAALTVIESSRHGQAIRTAKKHRKDMGKYLGGPVPFGWEVNREGYLVPNEGQQRIICSIIDMRKERWSYREISQKLRDEFNVRLSHEGVRRIFKNGSSKFLSGT